MKKTDHPKSQSGSKYILDTVLDSADESLKEALRPAGKAAATLFELANTLLIPIELLNARANQWAELRRQVIQDGVKLAQEKYEAYFPDNIQNTFQAVEDMPFAIDERLADSWKSLIRETSSPDYRPNFARILAELSFHELELLRILVVITNNHREIVPEFVHDLVGPPFKDAGGKINPKALSLAFASLELQSLIATKNNLNTLYWNLSQESEHKPQEINPTGHQVTSLGYELVRICED